MTPQWSSSTPKTMCSVPPGRTGTAWELVSPENNTVQHLLDILVAAKTSDFKVFISPHYFYLIYETWLFNGPLESDGFCTNTFARTGALTLEGFTGPVPQPGSTNSNRNIDDGNTVIASPHKVGAHKATTSSCNSASGQSPRSSSAGMLATCA